MDFFFNLWQDLRILKEADMLWHVHIQYSAWAKAKWNHKYFSPREEENSIELECIRRIFFQLSNEEKMLVLAQTVLLL